MSRNPYYWKEWLVVVLMILMSERGMCQEWHRGSNDESSSEEQEKSSTNTWIRRLPIAIEDNGYSILQTVVIDDPVSFKDWMGKIQASDDAFWMREHSKQELLKAVKNENIDFDTFNLVVFTFSEGEPRKITPTKEPSVNHWNRTATVWIDRGDENGGGCSMVYFALFYIVNKSIEKIYFDQDSDIYKCVGRVVVSNANPSLPSFVLLLHEKTETELWRNSNEVNTDLIFRRIPGPQEDAGYKGLQTAVLPSQQIVDQWKKDVIQSPNYDPPLQLWGVLDSLEAEGALDFDSFNIIIYAFEMKGHLEIQYYQLEIDKSDRSATFDFDRVERVGGRQEMLYYAFVFQVHKSIEKVEFFADEQVILVIPNRPDGTPTFENTTNEEL